MAATQPLEGIALIDCAKANALQGVEVTARLCGYGSDINRFQAALSQAGKDMGITLSDLQDLITDQFMVQRTHGIEISPDSPQDL
ncbi:MAG: hypothetical protein HC800_04275 [Phormidesmis sp. RL_2_1]|nr:hypothetical protein [Phormidesmis sp. RL_2_1]